MRAIVIGNSDNDGYGGPEVLHLLDLPSPAAGPGHVLIDVVAAGVNRADLLQRQGHYPPPAGASKILGLEVSGRVAAIGEGVTGWSVGDACVALLEGGGYAERVAVPAGQVIPPPPGVDLVTAAGVLEVAATVTANLTSANLKAGETILIHGGAGGIGSFAIQYAAALGARVLTTAGSPEKVAYCRKLGADAAIDYHFEWADEVSRLTEGRGVDVILDVMGAKYLEANVASLARRGRLVVIGLQGGRKGTLDLSALLAKNASVTATSLRQRPAAEKAEICAAVASRVWPMISSGAIRPAAESRFALDLAAQAHAHLESGRNVGKVVLVV